MKIDILASGSTGNAYSIDDGKTNLLIECGIPYKDILKKTNFFERMPSGCLISHSHNDHSLAFEDIRGMGIQLYMSKETRADLLKEWTSSYRYNINLIEDGKDFNIGSFKIRPLKLHHDVHCLGFLIYSKATKEKLFFATDTYYIEYVIPSCDYIMVEANYDLEIMNERIRQGHTDMIAKERLMRSHMEINSTLRWLSSLDLHKTKRIYLMHLSDGSSNADEFKRKVMEQTGVPCTIC